MTLVAGRAVSLEMEYKGLKARRELRTWRQQEEMSISKPSVKKVRQKEASRGTVSLEKPL